MNSEMILVVEDEEVLRKNILDIISHYGYSVESAASAEEGLLKAEEFVPGLIVSDIMLPNMDGFEMFSRIKQIPQLKNTAFIFLTAKSTRTDTRAGMNMGADDYLTKPFTQEELISSIKTRLEKTSKLSHLDLDDNKHPDTVSKKLSRLTKTEHKVLNAIAEGCTTPQIAQKLFVSKKTIENHRTNISKKLDLSGPNSLIKFALQLKDTES